VPRAGSSVARRALAAHQHLGQIFEDVLRRQRPIGLEIDDLRIGAGVEHALEIGIDAGHACGLLLEVVENRLVGGVQIREQGGGFTDEYGDLTLGRQIRGLACRTVGLGRFGGRLRRTLGRFLGPGRRGLGALRGIVSVRRRSELRPLCRRDYLHGSSLLAVCHGHLCPSL